MRWDERQDLGIGKLAGKRILLAGGTGFIGSRVTEYLACRGADVTVITRRKVGSRHGVSYLNVDLGNRGNLLRISAGGCFDAAVYMAANIPLAGSPKESYPDAKRSTLDPFVNFCDAFLPYVGKLVYISSVDVLGECIIPDYTEDAVPCRPTPYGLAKYCGELYAMEICRQAGTSCSILRFSQVYGPDEPVVRIIPILIRALTHGDEFILYTDGRERRRFLFIDDAVQAIILSVLSDCKGIFNIAGEETISINTLIRLMEEIWGRELRLRVLSSVPGKDNVPGIAKAEKLLSYKPQFSVREGLEEVRKGKEGNE